MAATPRNSIQLELGRLEDRVVPTVFTSVLDQVHADLGLNYINGSWDQRILEPDTGTYSDPPNTMLHANGFSLETAPIGPQWSFLGGSQKIYRLPQDEDANFLYLGVSATASGGSGFTSYQPADPRVTANLPYIRANILAVRGPGDMSIYQVNAAGNPVVWMATSDGIGASDLLYVPTGTGGEIHYNWAFSQPGIYEVDVQDTGYLGPNQTNPVTSPVTTYYFSVNPAGPSVAVPAQQKSVDEADVVFSAATGNGISVGGPTTAPAPINLTLTAIHGSFKLGSTAGLTFLGGGDGQSVIQIQGLRSDVNAALEGLAYRPVAQFNGVDVLAFQVDDGGEYLPQNETQSAAASVNIEVSGNTGARPADPTRTPTGSAAIPPPQFAVTKTFVPTASIAPRWVAVGAGTGDVPRVDVYDAGTGRLVSSFMAYETAFTGGVRVAVGDVTGDGYPDIVTTPGVGGGPRLQVFDNLSQPPRLSFFAYAPSFTGGLTVAVGDVTGDGIADIVTGAGPGGGPHVKVFDGRTGEELTSFFAFEPSFRGGIWVAIGDVNGDGRADIIVGAGAGGGPAVAVFDGKSGELLRKFFAYAPSFTGGVYVAAADLTGDRRAEIIVGAGAGGGPHVQIFDGKTYQNTASFFIADPSTTAPTGARVAAVDGSRDGVAELYVGVGSGTTTGVKTGAIPAKPSPKTFGDLSLVEPFLGAINVGAG